MACFRSRLTRLSITAIPISYANCVDISPRDGAIISVQGFARGESNILLERLWLERSLSVNTAAAGGNASLMTIG
jgi:RHH-type proline utilization regulon transcriptional repressor/proline dehydrogenase/delta 1-pyrroline-5-carboxylate dehydrogenase